MKANGQCLQTLPTATVGVDANTTYTGLDLDGDGIPDALRQQSQPLAVAGIDTNQDGHANYFFVGADLNHDGIPDALLRNHMPPAELQRLNSMASYAVMV